MFYLQNYFRPIANIRKKTNINICAGIYKQESSVTHIQKEVHLCTASKQLFPTNAVSLGKT